MFAIHGLALGVKGDKSMNRLQKMAMFNLGLGSACLLFQLVKTFVPRGEPIRLVISVLVLIITMPMGVSYFRRWKLARHGGQLYDERDKAIHQTALLVGMKSMFIVVFLATFLTFVSFGRGGTVRIGTLLDIFLLGALSLFVAESLTIIIKYGWANSGEQL
jgi:hypothetical protein